MWVGFVDGFSNVIMDESFVGAFEGFEMDNNEICEDGFVEIWVGVSVEGTFFVGSNDGTRDGEIEGDSDGTDVEIYVGVVDGEEDEFFVGALDGSKVLGSNDGTRDGEIEGDSDGTSVMKLVGIIDN